jgi:hypothetical protein
MFSRKRKEQAMYASIRKYYLIPGTAEQFMRRVQEGFVPLISKVLGFRVYYVLQVRDDEESVRRAADWVAKNLSSFIQGLPEVTVGYVRIFQFQGEQTASREEMLREQRLAAQNP